MKQKPDHPWRTGNRGGGCGRPRGSTAHAEIPTERVRRVFEKTGVSKTELAHRLGWTQANVTKLNRALGYKPDSTRSSRREIPRQLMSYELAVKICKALGASPVEMGI